MRCIKCGSDTKVTNIRYNLENKPRRRRECLNCKERFTTYEVLDTNEKILKPEIPKEVIIKEEKSQPIKKEKKIKKIKPKIKPKVKKVIEKKEKVKPKRPVPENLEDIEYEDLDEEEEFDYETF